jgi:hypothetical protein
MMKFHAILSPSDRFSEILFGLIMVLTITGTVGLETGLRKAVISAGIGACIAWGIVDGIIYVYSSLLERGRIVLVAQEASTCTGEGCDIRTIKEELKDTIVDTLGEREKHEVAQHIQARLKPVENQPVRREMIYWAGLLLARSFSYPGYLCFYRSFSLMASGHCGSPASSVL